MEMFIIISTKEVFKMEIECILALKWLNGLGFFWWVAGEEEGDRNVTLVYQAPCMRTVITADQALLTASDSGSTRLDKQHASPL